MNNTSNLWAVRAAKKSNFPFLLCSLLTDIFSGKRTTPLTPKLVTRCDRLHAAEHSFSYRKTQSVGNKISDRKPIGKRRPLGLNHSVSQPKIKRFGLEILQLIHNYEEGAVEVIGQCTYSFNNHNLPKLFWLQWGWTVTHGTRTNNNRTSKIMLNYRPNGLHDLETLWRDYYMRPNRFIKAYLVIIIIIMGKIWKYGKATIPVTSVCKGMVPGSMI